MARNIVMGLFVLVCLLALTWPGYPWLGNRIDPRMFGLPFSLFWNILWIVLTFLGLVVYDLTRPRDAR